MMIDIEKLVNEICAIDFNLCGTGRRVKAIRLTPKTEGEIKNHASELTSIDYFDNSEEGKLAGIPMIRTDSVNDDVVQLVDNNGDTVCYMIAPKL